MDWPLAIDRNRKALSPIIAALFALVSAAMGGKALTLPRHVHAAVMLVLRPAESAVRRLIVMAARGLVLKPRASRPLPAGLAGFASDNASKTPSFCLFDPLKTFSLDDYDNNALPRFSFHSGDDAEVQWPQSVPQDEPVNAALLFTRLRAIRSALNDLPRQAKRLARWQARRDLLLKTRRRTRISIFRPGLPPGWRQRPIHEIDDVLKECHGLALYAQNSPDTG